MRLPKQPLQCPTMATAGNVLTLAALMLPPLYMPNGYVGLVGAKFHLLLWLAGIGCALLLCCLQKSLRRNEHPAKQAQIAGLPLLLLCLSYTVAWLFAENPAVALWGLQGRYNGLIMRLACTVLYFAVQLTGGGIPAASATTVGRMCSTRAPGFSSRSGRMTLRWRSTWRRPISRHSNRGWRLC